MMKQFQLRPFRSFVIKDSLASVPCVFYRFENRGLARDWRGKYCGANESCSDCSVSLAWLISLILTTTERSFSLSGSNLRSQKIFARCHISGLGACSCKRRIIALYWSCDLDVRGRLTHGSWWLLGQEVYRDQAWWFGCPQVFVDECRGMPKNQQALLKRRQCLRRQGWRNPVPVWGLGCEP